MPTDDGVRFRRLDPSDAEAFDDETTFRSYLADQEAGLRWVHVAMCGGRFAGYVTLLWGADDPAFRDREIPEISDLRVRPEFRRRGIGTALVELAEVEAASRSDRVGLNVGLHSGYGATQRLYVRRGYVPDGSGAVLEGEAVPEGGTIRLDDDPIVTIRMTKHLVRGAEPDRVASVAPSEIGTDAHRDAPPSPRRGGAGRPTLARPAGVLFDFGDTILREERFDVAAGVKAVLEEAIGPRSHSAEELAEALSDLLVDLEPRRQASQLEFPPHMTQRLIYEPRGIRFDKSDEDLEWTFWSAAMTWRPEPGIREVFDALRDAGVPCGVVSNTAFRGQTLSRQLAVSGLDGAISWVMASADYVVRKPHRLLFDVAIRRLGTRPEATWFVGDSFECDVRGAAAAGMVPIWYDRAGAGTDGCAPAARAVANWSEFLQLLHTSMA